MISCVISTDAKLEAQMRKIAESVIWNVFSQRKRLFLILLMLVISSVILVAFSESAYVSVNDTRFRDALAQYNIVYAVDVEKVNTGNSLAPGNVQNTLGAQVVVNVTEMKRIADIAKLDAILLHQSAMSFIDQKTLIQAYQNGAIIVAFNTNGEQLANLLQDPCIATDNFASQDYKGKDFYTLVGRQIIGNSEDVALILSNPQSCNSQISGVKGQARIWFSKSSDVVSSSDEYNTFAQVFSNTLKGFREARDEFLKNHE